MKSKDYTWGWIPSILSIPPIYAETRLHSHSHRIQQVLEHVIFKLVPEVLCTLDKTFFCGSILLKARKFRVSLSLTLRVAWQAERCLVRALDSGKYLHSERILWPDFEERKSWFQSSSLWLAIRNNVNICILGLVGELRRLIYACVG
jgi:hypothetical protein